MIKNHFSSNQLYLPGYEIDYISFTPCYKRTIMSINKEKEQKGLFRKKRKLSLKGMDKETSSEASDESGQWICGKCYFINNIDLRDCELCLTPYGHNF